MKIESSYLTINGEQKKFWRVTCGDSQELFSELADALSNIANYLHPDVGTKNENGTYTTTTATVAIALHRHISTDEEVASYNGW